MSFLSQTRSSFGCKAWYWFARLVMTPISILLFLILLFVSMFVADFLPRFFSGLFHVCSQLSQAGACDASLDIKACDSACFVSPCRSPDPLSPGLTLLDDCTPLSLPLTEDASLINLAPYAPQSMDQARRNRPASLIMEAVTTPAEAYRLSNVIKKFTCDSGPELHTLELTDLVFEKSAAILVFPACPMGSVAERIQSRRLAPCEANLVLVLAVRAMARARIAGLEFKAFKLDDLLIHGMVSNEFNLSVDNVLVAGYRSLFELNDNPELLAGLSSNDLSMLPSDELTGMEGIVLTELVCEVLRSLDFSHFLKSDFASVPLLRAFPIFPSTWSELLDSCTLV